jgi:tetratricopeptide (TPR) repeat protein
MLTDNPNLERGKLLYEQHRYEQALIAFQQAIADNPDQYEPLLYQAYTLMQLDRYSEALGLADRLLHSEPDDPYILHLKAQILNHLKREDEALTLIEEAISQSPGEDAFWATASTLHFDRKDFDKALDAANEGLRLNPGNTICLNLRTLSLTKLHRTDEIASSIEETLAEDPGDAFSHASSGWALLESGNHQQARVHFAEALRISPGMSWAEQGMLQAIKAKNPLYRFFMRYYFWMANLKGGNQWLFIIGTFLALRWIDNIENPTIVVQVAQFTLVVFLWLSWFIDPLFNVLMLTDRDGRHLLNDRQRDRYRYVAGMLGLGVPMALVGYFGQPLNQLWLANMFLTGLMLIGLVLPLSAWIEVSEGKNRQRMRWVFGGMAVTAVLSALLLPFTGLGVSLFSLFTIELLGFMILRNYLLIQHND